MVVELELHIQEAGWRWSSRRFFGELSHASNMNELLTCNSCMAHIINLATQALLKSRSKAPHHNPYDTEAHLPEGDAERRDDIV